LGKRNVRSLGLLPSSFQVFLQNISQLVNLPFEVSEYKYSQGLSYQANTFMMTTLGLSTLSVISSQQLGQVSE